MKHTPRALLAALLLVSLSSGTSLADDVGGGPPAFLKLIQHQNVECDPRWQVDEVLQARVDGAMNRLEAQGFPIPSLVGSGKLSVAVVELTGEESRLAQVNGHESMYAASVPKIAVLYAAYQAEKDGRLVIDEEFRRTLARMVRVSSNSAATKAIQRVGFDYIASVLWQSGLYDPDLGGGLWLGKAYGGKGDRWHRDPLNNLSHGASALSVASLLTVLARGELVDERASAQMKMILSRPGIEHKFVKGLKRKRPRAQVFRKSGSWQQWHGDAALIERVDGARYVVVALCQTPRGGALLERLIVELDACVDAPPQSAPS